jgi:histidinol-phosphate aminotransferase
MYAVSAQVNDLEIVSVPLLQDSLLLDVPAILKALQADPLIKLAYLCSPGNPTGATLAKDDIAQILAAHWNGIIVLDEAYIDFAPEDASLAQWVTEFPNLVVMQTLSKAFGLASIRLGVAFASPDVANLLNSLKAPYNISTPTSILATQALSPESLAGMRSRRAKIVQQRDRLVAALPKIRGVGAFRGGFDSNFLLVQMVNESTGEPSNEIALQVYERLAEDRGVVVRFRGNEKWCTGCLRITVGTEEEVDRFLVELASVLAAVLDKGTTSVSTEQEQEKEAEASQVVN